MKANHAPSQYHNVSTFLRNLHIHGSECHLAPQLYESWSIRNVDSIVFSYCYLVL
jgi:hypothetical protein